MCSNPSSPKCEASDEAASVSSERYAPSKIASSASISSISSFPVYDLTTNLSLTEVKSALADLIKTKGPDLIQACKNFDRRSTGKIPKIQLRQVIRMFCFLISAAQFDALCNEFQLDLSGKINYSDFFTKLCGSKITRKNSVLKKIPDDLPIDEVELRVQEKIKSNLRDVIRSFWMFDVNKDGLIQKSELRRIIRNYCFDLKDDVFDELWKSYDPKGTGIISYRDFLVKLGISADRYKNYMPRDAANAALSGLDDKANCAAIKLSCEQKCKRAALENRDDPAIQGLPLDEIIVIFVDRVSAKNGLEIMHAFFKLVHDCLSWITEHVLQKLHGRQNLLKDVFKLFDDEKIGEISFSNFQGVINFFVMPMSPTLFSKVMKKLEIPMDQNVAYQKFLSSFCKSNKYQSSRTNEKPDCTPIVQQIKNHVLNPEARLRSVFTKISPDSEWQVTRPELKKAIELGLDCKLSDEEFKELTTLLDPGNTNVINCADFIKLFEEATGLNCSGPETAGAAPPKTVFEKYKTLKGDKLKSKLKYHMNKNLLTIEKAILVSDPDQSGFILPEKLHRVLSGLCFPLTEEQFQEIIQETRKYGDYVNYHEFLKMFKKKPDEDIKKWIETVDKLVEYKSRCSPEIDVSEVEEMLKDSVRYRKTAMLNDFRALDVCNVGIVCKDDVRNIFSKFAFRMTDDQFNEIWSKLPRNKINQLLYDQFIEEYSLPPETFPIEKIASKPLSDESQDKDVRTGSSKDHTPQDSSVEADAKPNQNSENRKTLKEFICLNAPHLKPVIESIEPTIVRNIRSIKFHLRRADPKVTGMVDFVTLKHILTKAGVQFSKEDEFRILEYFDSNLRGKINYRDFLNIFVWYA